MSDSTIRTVRVDDLSVDPRVQRQLDVRRVRKLANDWDPKMVGVLTVSHRLPGSTEGTDGTVALEEFIVLDGQTRWTAAQEAGVTQMTAEVFDGLTTAEEASIFLKHNDRKGVIPRDRFRLAVMAEDERSLAIRDIAAMSGWYVQGMLSAETKGLKVFSAVAAVERIYDLDNGKALRRTFKVIENAWGHVPNAVSSETLFGIGMLFGNHPTGIDTPGLIHKLSKLGLNAYLAAVSDRRRTHPGMSTKTAAQEWTVDLYNRGRRTHRV